jgi:hypothetical protein
MYRAKGRSNAACISSQPSWSIYHPSSPSTHEEDYLSIMKEVALKVIPKKKVKGNEAAVWGEMDVLKCLDHPTIVRIVWPTSYEFDLIVVAGQILRMV